MIIDGDKSGLNDFFDEAGEMHDHELAVELIARLNLLIEDDLTREAFSSLFKHEILWRGDKDHPTIQVWDMGAEITARVRFLGVLNGIVGTIQEGPHAGWGMITVTVDDETGLIERFRLTDELTSDPEVSRQ